MRERWLSKRAIGLHVGVLLFVPACLVAAWWQATRALGGNGLSYLYSVEWPVFAILGIYFWWMLLHTDYDEVGLRGTRKKIAAAAAAAAAAAEGADSGHAPRGGGTDDPRAAAPAGATSGRVGGDERGGARVDDDPELAAYNARLAALAATGPKTWRNPEAPVVRRSS